MPVKQNGLLRIFKNQTEKVAEYQIEITKFQSENYVETDLEISAPSGKPTNAVIVRAFKFKCCLSSTKKLGESPAFARTLTKQNRKFSNEDEDQELPTMNMLKYTSNNNTEHIVDSGRIPQKLDEKLVSQIISDSHLK